MFQPDSSTSQCGGNKRKPKKKTSNVQRIPHQDTSKVTCLFAEFYTNLSKYIPTVLKGTLSSIQSSLLAETELISNDNNEKH